MFCSNCGNKLKENAKFCSKCGESVESSSPHAISHAELVEHTSHHNNEFKEYYAPSTTKMVVLNILSLGIYSIYWMAKEWGMVNKITNSKSKDTWGKAIFSLLFCYSLFKLIKEIAQKENLKVTYSPGWLTTGFIILSFVWRADNGLGLLGFLSVLCLIPVNNAMKKYLHKNYGFRKSKFLTKGEVISIIVGILVVIFWIVVGLNEATKEGNALSTEPSKYNDMAGYQYPSNIRESFTKSCASNDSLTDKCSCLLNYFETNYSLNEYIKFEEEYAKTKVVPEVFNTAINFCTQ